MVRIPVEMLWANHDSNKSEEVRGVGGWSRVGGGRG
jgi:hypothetical protein